MSENEYDKEFAEERGEEMGLWKNTSEDEDLDNMYDESS
jgi:hypothetical protein